MSEPGRVYYNDADSHCCQWVRNLIEQGTLAGGTVDERGIEDIQAADLVGHTRCHFFAGIGGWEYALALAGWPDNRPVWTGSCPCQPFSAAGKQEGEEDPRHLWPAFFALIRQCRPDCVFGEQVASARGYDWIDGVRADLEDSGYTFGAADLPACCQGAPHIRQRLFWVAYTQRPGVRLPGCGADGTEAGGVQGADGQRQRLRADAGAERDTARRLPNAGSKRRQRRQGEQGSGRQETERGEAGSDAGDDSGRLDDTDGQRHDRQGVHLRRRGHESTPAGTDGTGESGFWSDYVLLPCRDGKVRRSQPGLQPVVDGTAFRLACGTAGHGSRAKALRGIGNAIVPAVAALFIRAFLEATSCQH